MPTLFATLPVIEVIPKCNSYLPLSIVYVSPFMAAVRLGKLSPYVNLSLFGVTVAETVALFIVTVIFPDVYGL